MIYVVSDIHGCLNTLKKLLEKAHFNENLDTLYILGDIVDRGPHIWELYEWVKSRYGKNVFMIMGNHEDGLISDVYTLKGKTILSSKKNNLTEEEQKYVDIYRQNICVFDQYYTIQDLLYKGKTVDDLVEMCSFFENLPYYYEIDVNNIHYRLVHAYCRKDLNKTKPQEFIWNRNFAEKDMFCIGENVIYGHTPTIFDGKDGNIEIKKDVKTNSLKINIDCGCVYGNKLCLLRLDDMKYWYQKNIDIGGEHYD